jgi:hypothetical protein
MTRLVFFGLPALAGLAVAIAAWAPTRRFGPHRLNPVLIGIVLLSAGVGMAVYLGRAPGVSGGSALEGATIASLACVLLAGVYYAAGRYIRQLVALVVFWAASLLPYYYFAVLVTIIVAAFSQCPPGSYECPV